MVGEGLSVKGDAGEMVKVGMELVDPVTFGGVSISLVHFCVFVRRSCGEEAICVSPSVFYRILSKYARRNHGEFNLSSNTIIYSLDYLLLQVEVARNAKLVTSLDNWDNFMLSYRLEGYYSEQFEPRAKFI